LGSVSSCEELQIVAIFLSGTDGVDIGVLLRKSCGVLQN